MIPKVQTSTWNHGNKKLVFTVSQPVEVQISPEDLISCITYDTCSTVLTEILNKTAEMYASHNGRFTMPYSAANLTIEAKEFINDMSDVIREATL